MTPRYKKGISIDENQVETYLVKRIEEIGGLCIKFNPHNNRGLPDRICFFLGGFVILIEVKRPGARPRKNQMRQLETFQKLGFKATWVDSFEEVDRMVGLIHKYITTHQVSPTTHVCDLLDCTARDTGPDVWGD